MDTVMSALPAPGDTFGWVRLAVQVALLAYLLLTWLNPAGLGDKLIATMRGWLANTKSNARIDAIEAQQALLLQQQATMLEALSKLANKS